MLVCVLGGGIGGVGEGRWLFGLFFWFGGWGSGGVLGFGKNMRGGFGVLGKGSGSVVLAVSLGFWGLSFGRGGLGAWGLGVMFGLGFEA